MFKYIKCIVNRNIKQQGPKMAILRYSGSDSYYTRPYIQYIYNAHGRSNITESKACSVLLGLVKIRVHNIDLSARFHHTTHKLSKLNQISRRWPSCRERLLTKCNDPSNVMYQNTNQQSSNSFPKTDSIEFSYNYKRRYRATLEYWSNKRLCPPIMKHWNPKWKIK